MYTLKNVYTYMSITGGLHLVGNVYDNPRFSDGTQIHTSRIVDFVKPTEDSIICTTKSGSLYTFAAEDMIKGSLEEIEL